MSKNPDPNFQLLHTLRLRFDPDVPDFVKKASVADYQQTDNLNLGLFADPTGLSLPVHTKAATWVSGLYFWGRQANGEAWKGSTPVSAVESNLFKAARAHRIFPDVLELRNRITERTEWLQKQAALTDDDYALRINSERKLPAFDTPSVRRSAERFYIDRVRYPYHLRKEAATALLNKARQFGVTDLPVEQLDYLVKAAGIYPATRTAVTFRLAARATVSKDLSVRDAFEKMASFLYGGLEKGGSVTPDRRTEACGLIDRVDRAASLFDQYKYGMPMPEEIFYEGLSVKVASNAPTLGLPSGNAYRFCDLEDAAPCFEAVGPHCADSVLTAGQVSLAKAAAYLADAPADELRIFEAALEATGIEPVREKTAACVPSAAIFERLATLPVSSEKRAVSALTDGPPVFCLTFRPDESIEDAVSASPIPTTHTKKAGQLLDRNPLNV